MRVSILALFLSVQCVFTLHAQKINPVTISDFEERIALIYWSSDYELLASQLEEFLAIDRTHAARNYFRLGIAYCHEGKFDKAFANFTQGIKEDPNLPFNYAGLALLSDSSLPLYKKALVYSKKFNPQLYSDRRVEKRELAVVLPKSNAWIHHNIGIYYLEKKQYDSALYFFKKAKRERPDETEHLVGMSVASYFFHEFNAKKAKKYLTQASRLENKDVRIQLLQSYFAYMTNDLAIATLFLQEIKSKQANLTLVLVLKELYAYKANPSTSFEASILAHLTKEPLYEPLVSEINGKPIDHQIKRLHAFIEQELFRLDLYYNGKIYPHGGTPLTTYSGNKHTEERLYLRK